MPFTNRHLSERELTQTVFVTAFFILRILYHVLHKKSNVFLRKIENYSICQNNPWDSGAKIEKLPVDKPSSLWFNDRYPYNKDIDGKLALSQCSREPVVGGNRCGGIE